MTDTATNGPLLRPPPDAISLKHNWMARTAVVFAALLLVLAGFGIWQHYRLRPFSPARWQSALGPERGRMLKSLLAQTDFVGFSRANVEVYLGAPDFDERQFWYDLGPSSGNSPVDPRAAVGDSLRLYVVFSYNPAGAITDVLYNHRRPILGSAEFDSLAWFGTNHAGRATVITKALGQIRTKGLSMASAQALLGPADGARVRAHYDVGSGGEPFGSQKALTLEYNLEDIVTSSEVTH